MSTNPGAFPSDDSSGLRSSRHRAIAAGLALAVLLVTGGLLIHRWVVLTVPGALPQQAYLWQRQWTAGVRAAVAGADAPGSPLAGLCVAYAEIEPAASGAPIVRRSADVDWTALAHCRLPVGFAVRVRVFPGEVGTGHEPFPALRAVLAELCAAARAGGVRPVEIQVDFDCPTSRLRGFAAWLRALRAEFPGERFTFTALPAWLRSRDFGPLAATTGGYVLQVHWLAGPGPDGRPPDTLCDPALAREAVGRAAHLGVPFRVALPTYGYRLVLDAGGRLLAGAGEGSALEAARPPPGGEARVLMADPAALAGLVAGWTARHPAALRGVIWYRLPVAGDRLNWTTRTLWAVAAGRTPRAKLAVRFASAADGGPFELRLCNDGDADAPLPTEVAVRCASIPQAADGVGGFECRARENSLQELVFIPRIQPGEVPRTLPAGRSLVFGWVRVPGTTPADGRPVLTVSINPEMGHTSNTP